MRNIWKGSLCFKFMLLIVNANAFFQSQHLQINHARHRLQPRKIKSTISQKFCSNNNQESEEDQREDFPNRRSFINVVGTGLVGTTTLFPSNVNAKGFSLFQQNSETTMAARNLVGDSALRSPVDIAEIMRMKSLTSETCLLTILPVKNTIFRTMQSLIENVSDGENPDNDEKLWLVATTSAKNALEYLDKQRSNIEPKFNENDDPLRQILKGERGEDLIENLRENIVSLKEATQKKNTTRTNTAQKKALLALNDLGELLVDKFPYEVPKTGKYSYLPRLLGRARITFTIERQGTTLGDIIVIADGYTAPITAGNFVDLASRGFYTGLPIKSMKKRLSSPNEDAAKSINLSVLGSFNEGFYDPLTAKLRRLPLEILRIDKSTGVAEPTYPKSFLGPSPPIGKISDKLADPVLSQEVGTRKDNKPVLNFDIPGLVAMNHPDKNINGASAEFFILSKKELNRGTSKMFDNTYAPFGYIVNGFDLIENLQPGDLISSTDVSEWGILNLQKIKGTNLQDLIGND